MPHLTCICENRIDLSDVPNPNGYYLRSEERFYDIMDSVLELYKRGLSEDAFEMEVHRAFTPIRTGVAPHIYQCTSCGRLAVFAHPSADPVEQWYAPESDEHPPRLLSSLTRSDEKSP